MYIVFNYNGPIAFMEADNKVFFIEDSSETDYKITSVAFDIDLIVLHDLPVD